MNVPSPRHLVVTCEHATNAVPERWREVMAGAADALGTHRGWDPGAREVAHTLAAELAAPLVEAAATRLLVDLNRSLSHPKVWSEWTRELPPEQQTALLHELYWPYRRAALEAVRRATEQGIAVHVSVHSFTPQLQGAPRKADVGLLFDPTRPDEAAFARAWRERLRKVLPTHKVFLNAPYRGFSDGLTTALRGFFADGTYAGIEVELNQRHATQPAVREELTRAVLETLRGLL